MKHFRSSNFILWCVVFGAVPEPGAQGQATTCIIVRHAEKDTLQEDPDLSPAGVKRAKALDQMLAAGTINAIYSTQFRRTINTARVLSERRGIPISVVPHDRALTVRDNAERLIKKILAEQRGTTCVIISHSNVIPELLRALGVSNPPAIDDNTYDDLFIVTTSPGGHPSFLHLKYGDKSP